MRITKEHYKELETALAIISATVKARYQKEGLSHQRYLWDCFWYICDNGFNPTPLYNYMNDNHIETALNKIMGKY